MTRPISGNFPPTDIWCTDVAILYRFHDKLRCGLIAFVVRLKWDYLSSWSYTEMHLKTKWKSLISCPDVYIYAHGNPKLSQSVIKFDINIVPFINVERDMHISIIPYNFVSVSSVNTISIQLSEYQ